MDRERVLRGRLRKRFLKPEPKCKRIRFTPKTQTCRNDSKTYKIRNLRTKCQMRPSQINFINNRFRAKYPGTNRTIFSTFGALKYGKLEIQDLPKIRVFRYRNKCFSPDTRRLYLYKIYARWYKVAHGRDLFITVIFIERFHLFRMSRKLGVQRHNICHERLPMYDDLKDEHKKFKLFLRPKKNQSKHLDSRGCRLSKGELNRLRQGQLPSMTWYIPHTNYTPKVFPEIISDLRHTSEGHPNYTPLGNRPPIPLGDYIEKYIGDQLRETLEDKTYCFAGRTTQKTLKGRGRIKKAERNGKVSPILCNADFPKLENSTRRKHLEHPATHRSVSSVDTWPMINQSESSTHGGFQPLVEFVDENGSKVTSKKKN